MSAMELQQKNISDKLLKYGKQHGITAFSNEKNFAEVLSQFTEKELTIIDKALDNVGSNKKLFEKTGPIGKVIKFRKKLLQTTDLKSREGLVNNIQGAFAELEVAGIHPGCCECEVKLPRVNGDGHVTFDWKTIKNEFLEIKDINWVTQSEENLNRIFKNFIDKNEVAQAQSGIFIVYSKQFIPHKIQKRLLKHNINWKLIE
jgi:hypothetical protein